MYKRVETALCLFFLTFFVSCMLITCLSGCSAERKAQREEKKDAKAVQRLLSRDILDDVCAENYPVEDSLIKGDSIILFDTLYLEGGVFTDTLITKDTVRITTIRTLPPTVITKTIRLIDTIIREDNAKINALDDVNRKLVDLLAKEKSETDKYKGRAANRGRIMWILIGVICLIIGYNIYRIKNKITKL